MSCKCECECKASGEITFSEYAKSAGLTAIYPNRGSNIIYPTLGLSGEVGEISEKIKKMIRDENGEMSEERRQALKKELGDVMWYLAAMCHELGFEMGDVAEANIEKLYSRMNRGKIKGNGDDR